MNLYQPANNDVDFVRGHLPDDYSRLVFDCLLTFYQTGDDFELQEQIFRPKIEHCGLITDIGKLSEMRRNYAKIALWGIGDFGVLLLLLLRHYSLTPDVIIDKSKKSLPQSIGFFEVPLLENQFSNIDFCAPQEFFSRNVKEYAIVVGARALRVEILRELNQRGISQDLIFSGFVDKCETAHYFDNELLTPVPDEVYLDCGAYHLENALEFRQFCGGKYKKIFAFEASKENFSQAKQIAEQENMECLALLNAAVWSSNEILHFNDRGGTGSALSNGGSEVVKAVTIDEIVGTEKVTLIKMDIEGAELEALRGAAETIKRSKPRMAISVYHKETDIIEIPKFVLSLKHDYQVYIRPERFILSDVVMYFV